MQLTPATHPLPRGGSARPRPLQRLRCGRAGRLLVAAAAAAAAVALPAAAAATAKPRLESPRVAELARAEAIRDDVLARSVVRQLQATLADWGGRYTTAGGEAVTIRVSDSYPEDEAVVRRWVDYLGTLLHGPELSSVTVYLLRPDELERACGPGALACYSARESLIIAPGEDPEPGTSAESVLAHEYGHHLAASRANPPWEAIDYGTKRWASYQDVCRGVRTGRLFSGAQQNPRRYRLSAAEAFAESYRLLNERRLGVPETPWQIVEDVLYPDPTSLALLQQDIVEPWRAATTTDARGSFTRRGTRTRTHTVATPLDGTLRVTLRTPRPLRLQLQLLAADGSRVGQATVSGGARAVQTTVCGSRSYRLRVTRLAGAGAYRLSISKP